MTSVIDNQREHGSVNPETLTRDQMYNLIGQYNMQIVQIEFNIPKLEDQLRSMPDDFQGDRSAIQESLHDLRKEVTGLRARVGYLFGVILQQLEDELEEISKVDLDRLPNADRAHKQLHMGDLIVEIKRIKKIVSG